MSKTNKRQTQQPQKIGGKVKAFFCKLWAGIKAFFCRLWARIKEFFRKKIVALKRSPQTIPLVMLAVAFIYYSFNLTSMSNTTNKINTDGMGLSQFAIMLLSILSIVCMLNAFPKRKKANVPMVVLLFVMMGIIIYCDIHYMGSITSGISRADHPIPADDNILFARSMLSVHVVLECVCAALVALLPVYSKLLRKINTSVAVVDNGNMADIELTD